MTLDNSFVRGGKNLVIDTGPLLFLLAGYHKHGSIGKTELTQEYTKDDFDLLMCFISNFRHIIVTPHILAEVSNLVNTRIHRNEFRSFMETVIRILSDYQEVYIEKDKVFTKDEIRWLGITDVGILMAAGIDNSVILTKDFNLSRLCEKKDLSVVHFDKLRELSWSKAV
jgi:hypothetical protein